MLVVKKHSQPLRLKLSLASEAFSLCIFKLGQSNPKSYWSLAKKLMGKSTSSPIPPLQNEVTGESVVNDEDKANLLNTFFCSISEIIDSDLPTPVFL